MKVYLVTKGERGEGGWPVGICLTLEAARGCVWQYLADNPIDFMFYTYDENSDEPTGWSEEHYQEWHWKCGSDGLSWTSGCDYLLITEHEVWEPPA